MTHLFYDKTDLPESNLPVKFFVAVKSGISQFPMMHLK